jgi:hypothetical protein
MALPNDDMALQKDKSLCNNRKATKPQPQTTSPPSQANPQKRKRPFLTGMAAAKRRGLTSTPISPLPNGFIPFSKNLIGTIGISKKLVEKLAAAQISHTFAFI